MDAYVDSTVLLRVILGEPDRLDSWVEIDRAVSSELLRLECLRTIDRARVRVGLPDEEVARLRQEVFEACESIVLVPLDGTVLARAADPFPTSVGTLDAVHLASALLARDRYPGLIMATHDAELAVASRAEGFEVHGA